MMNKNKKLIIIAVVLISLIFMSIYIPTNASDELSPEALAVTLVIDNSGSMKSTDPLGLRETAANIFIDLLSPEDYLSVITFNTKQKVVIPIQQIKNSSNKAGFKKILSQNIEESGDTDYLGALNEGSKQLSTVNKGNVRKVILFLTDGEPDPNMARKKDTEFMNSYMNSLWKAVSNLALNKCSVYSIGFSKGVNKAVLERISKDTQGSLKISSDSTELALNFFNILGNLKNRKELFNETLELKESKSLEFDLDENTAQTTMVFASPEGKPLEISLISPDGKSAKSGVIINKYDKYSIVTINQNNENLSG
ncbi:MAG: VWA domain-containing protein, partial [Bacillota bacterium]|nr:VWA domain-containing protein [Bacillota bacterium]